MSGPQRYNRNTRDANEQELINVAEKLGGHWFENGPFDGWLFVPRMAASWHPVEIKDPAREGLAHEYTPQQKKALRRFEQIGARLWTWRTTRDVMRDLGVVGI